jgi:hypothetical protein
VIAPYIEPASSVAEHSNDCPECGDPKPRIRGYRTLATGNVQVQLFCKKCPKWYRIPLSKFESNKKLRGV